MAFDKKNLVAFIDIASGKISVMVCSLNKDNKPIVLGKGEAISVGFKNGRVVNVSEFTKSVNAALDMAEEKKHLKVSDVVISLSDFNYKSYFLSSSKVLPFERNISVKDIQDCSGLLPILKHIDVDKEKLVHVVPIRFVVDGNVVENPEKVFGKKLEIFYHIITVDAKMYSDLISSLNSINLNVKRVVVNSYASALATLVDDDKKVGSLVIDIGKSTMSVAVFLENNLLYNMSLNLGGDVITNSLSKRMNVRFDEAERLKKKYGAKFPLPLDFSEYISVFMIGENGENESKDILKSDLLSVLNELSKEIVLFLKKCLDDKNISPYFHRVVLTGGGAKLRGFKEIVEEVFRLPTRIAKPVKFLELGDDFDDPTYSTLVGLFLFYYYKSSGILYYDTNLDEKEHKNLWEKFKKFLDENFG